MHTDDAPRLRAHLFSWALGTPVPETAARAERSASATVVLESAADLEHVLDSPVVDDDTVVLAPGYQPYPYVTGYEGSLIVPGDEFSIDDALFLQTYEYRAAPYVSILSGTFVRVTEDADLAAFVEDADAARSAGTFAPVLLNRAVRLADRCALGATSHECGPRTRLLVRAGGEVATSPTGSALGTVDDPFTALVANHNHLRTATDLECGACLAGSVGETARTAALRARPWLGRYIDALDAIRELAARGGTGLHVSGFGHRLLAGLGDADAHDDGPGPLLLWSDDAAYLYDGRTRRTVRMSHRAGQVAEALLVHGTLEAASTSVPSAALLQVAGTLASVGLPLVAARESGSAA